MCTGRDSNQGPLGPKSDALTTAPLRPHGLLYVWYYGAIIEVHCLLILRKLNKYNTIYTEKSEGTQYIACAASRRRRRHMTSLKLCLRQIFNIFQNLSLYLESDYVIDNTCTSKNGSVVNETDTSGYIVV